MTTIKTGDKPEILLVNCILELKKKCTFENEIAEAFDIEVSELRCLVQLDATGGTFSNEVCAKMGLSKSRGSRIINRLVAKGFVKMEPDAEDKRYAALSLTADGTGCVRKIAKEKNRCEEMLRSKLAPATYKKAKEIISELLEAV